MKPKNLANEIIQLIETSRVAGGPEPSRELLHLVATLRDGVYRLETSEDGASVKEPGKRVVARKRRRPSGVEMAETIEQLVAKLNRAFQSDTGFEAVISEAEAANLTKNYVVVLYNKLFKTQRKFSASVTKPDLYNAIRRERIARVRARA